MKSLATATLLKERSLCKQASGWPRRLLPVMLAALAIRMVVVYFYYRQLPDADLHYEQFGWEMGWIARALASGHGFSSPFYPWSGPTAMQPPLYPALLALIFRLFGVYTLASGFIILTLNSLFSSLTCIPVYYSAKHSLGSRAGFIAASVWALYPFAIYFSAGRVWEYSLTGILFTTSFCVAQRICRTSNPLAWAGWGALAGLTAFSNPATLATLPFLGIFAAWQAHRTGRTWGRAAANLFLMALTTVAVLTPWTIRNYRALGIICPVRDNYWIEMYDANGGDDSFNPNFAHPSSNPAEMVKWLAMGEPAFIAEKHRLAVDYIHAHPGFLIRRTIRRFFYYWTGYWSLSVQELREQPYEPFNIGMVSLITALMLRGICRLWRFDREKLFPYLVLICLFPCAYYITHALMDYRQPIEPAIVVMAVAGAYPWKLRSSDAKEVWNGVPSRQ